MPSIIHKLFGKGKKSAIPAENLNIAIVEESHNDTLTYEIFLEELLKAYTNKYIWNYVLIDIIYNLLTGIEMYVAIKGKSFSDLYLDEAVGPVESSFFDKTTETLILHYEKVNAEIIVDTIVGTGIFSFDQVLEFAGYQQYHSATDWATLVNHDDRVIAVCPQNDGEGLGIRVNENLTDKTLVLKKIQAACSKYGVTLVMRSKSEDANS
ncbi:MAG: hypothetical protein ACYDBB_10945 [Armatimonadota bacterium]